MVTKYESCVLGSMQMFFRILSLTNLCSVTMELRLTEKGLPIGLLSRWGAKERHGQTLAGKGIRKLVIRQL